MAVDNKIIITSETKDQESVEVFWNTQGTITFQEERADIDMDRSQIVVSIDDLEEVIKMLKESK